MKPGQANLLACKSILDGLDRDLKKNEVGKENCSGGERECLVLLQYG